ncbi:unnamed protein product, partial [Mesorhabditis belari]|uniref:Saposin B-type domain-containing protein n=1 Tax=Mesorhabditis belari TaxID=2138241 RepID=A0AAF3EJ33_9BILA
MGNEESTPKRRETSNIYQLLTSLTPAPTPPRTTAAKNVTINLSCTEPDGDSLLRHLRICDEHFQMRHGRGYHEVSAQELHQAILKESLCSHCLVEHSNCGQKTDLLALAKLYKSLLLPVYCAKIVNRMDNIVARDTYKRLVEKLKWLVDTDLESRDVDRHFNELELSINKLQMSLLCFEQGLIRMIKEMNEISETTMVFEEMKRALILFSFAILGLALKQRATSDPCAMCEYVVNQAQSHYRRGESKNGVERELMTDCASLRRIYGEQAVRDCEGWIRKNIDIIYKDMQNGKSTYQICHDMGECVTTVVMTTTTTVKTTTTPTTTTTTPTTTTTTTTVTTTTKAPTTTPLDFCPTCIQLIDAAHKHFGTKVYDQTTLQAQLLNECQTLDQTLIQRCNNDINQYISTIFSDMKSGKTSTQVCTDIKECF